MTAGENGSMPSQVSTNPRAKNGEKQVVVVEVDTRWWYLSTVQLVPYVVSMATRWERRPEWVEKPVPPGKKPDSLVANSGLVARPKTSDDRDGRFGSVGDAMTRKPERQQKAGVCH